MIDWNRKGGDIPMSEEAWRRKLEDKLQDFCLVDDTLMTRRSAHEGLFL